MSAIKNLIYKKTKKDKPTALCFFYDGKFDCELSQLGINLIGVPEFSIYPWCTDHIPDNVKLISQQEIPNYSYDFCIFNNLIKHRDYILSYRRALHIPGFVINHEPYLETPFHFKKRLEEAKINCYSTEFSQENSIKYGVKLPNKVNKDIDVLIDENLTQNNHTFIQQIKKEIPNTVILGNNPESSLNVSPKNYEEYREYFNRCRIYINLSQQPNCNHSLLWAMAGGSLIISINNIHIKEIVNENNSVICNNLAEMINKIKIHLNKTAENKLNNANETVKVFSYEDFENKWKTIIEKYKNEVYK